MALVDLIVILPFYLGVLIPLDLRFMRVFRLFMVFKLTRYRGSMALLAAVLKNEARPIGAAVFVLSILLVVAASFAYLVESDAQPEAFGSIPAAMYWAIATMTTVGYGDVAPQTFIGKFLASIIMILGYGIIAVPTGIVSAEVASARRPREVSCRSCGSAAHAEHARFCDACGFPLPD